MQYEDAYDLYVEQVADYETPMSRKEFERRMEEWNERHDRVSPAFYHRSTNYTAEV